MASSCGARLRAIADLLDEHSALLEERVSEARAPSGCDAATNAYLRGLSDAEVLTLEREGAPAWSAHECPPPLRELARRSAELARLPRLDASERVAPIVAASEQKRAQIAALVDLVRARFADVGRVVELGAGRGHATRALAALLDRAAIGVERREHVTLRARALTDDTRVHFVCADAGGAELALDPSDLLLGLHACGGLGDRLVTMAASDGPAVLHIGCCPQKIDGEVREAVSSAGRGASFSVARIHLGLANLVATPLGEAPLVRRQRRHAVRWLLRSRGLDVEPGAESRGIARRQFRHPLPVVARTVFARRDLSPPSEGELKEAARVAEAEHRLIRRYALPRRLLARPLEVAIALDRAAALEEAGREVEIVEVFDASVSPRNIAVIAAARGAAQNRPGGRFS